MEQDDVCGENTLGILHLAQVSLTRHYYTWPRWVLTVTTTPDPGELRNIACLTHHQSKTAISVMCLVMSTSLGCWSLTLMLVSVTAASSGVCLPVRRWLTQNVVDEVLWCDLSSWNNIDRFVDDTFSHRLLWSVCQGQCWSTLWLRTSPCRVVPGTSWQMMKDRSMTSSLTLCLSRHSSSSWRWRRTRARTASTPSTSHSSRSETCCWN